MKKVAVVGDIPDKRRLPQAILPDSFDRLLGTAGA